MAWTDAEAREYLALRERLLALDRAGFDYSRYADDAEGFITDVLGEYLTDDLREICRAVVQYPVVIAQSGNGTGKSWIEARLAAWFYKCQDRPRVYCAAAPPESNLEGILWAEIIDVVSKHPYLFDDSSIKTFKIARNSKEFIEGVTIPKQGTDQQRETSFGGKHSPSMLHLVDEGDGVPDPVFNGIETCQSGGKKRLFITFNPKERKGKVYQMVNTPGRAHVIKLTAFNHPNVITGENVVPGAVDRATTVQRIALMTRPLAPDEPRDKRCFELPDFLVGCVPLDKNNRPLPALVPGWYRIEDQRFFHVVLGEYPVQADNQLISEEWIDAARSRYDLFVAKHGVIVPEAIRCTVGVDIADRSTNAATIKDEGSDSSVECKRFGNFVHPLVQWQQMDPLMVGDLVHTDLVQAGITQLSAIYCDGTGVGASTAPYLTRHYSRPAVKVMVASSATEKTDLGEFGLLLDQLMWEVREWLRTDLAMLPPDEALREELMAFTYEIKAGKLKVSSTADVKALIGRSPDRARALMLSFMRSGWFTEMDLS